MKYLRSLEILFIFFVVNACTHGPSMTSGDIKNSRWISGTLKPDRSPANDATNQGEAAGGTVDYRPGSTEFPLAIHFSAPDEDRVKIEKYKTNVDCGLMSELNSDPGLNKLWFLPQFTSEDVAGLPPSFYEAGIVWKPGEWPLPETSETDPSSIEAVMATDKRELTYSVETQTLRVVDHLPGGFVIEYILEVEPSMQRVRSARVRYLDGPEGKDLKLRNELLRIDCMPAMVRFDPVNSMPYAILQGLLPITHR